MKQLVWVVFFFVIMLPGYSADPVLLTKDQPPLLIADKTEYLRDPAGTLTFAEVTGSRNFAAYTKKIINVDISKASFWIRFTVANKDNVEKNYLEAIQPFLYSIDFYWPDQQGTYQVIHAGQQFPFEHRIYTNSTNFLFDLNLQPGQQKTYYLKIRSKQQLVVPLQVISGESLAQTVSNRSLWFGIYCGIIVVMVLYNFFIYMSTHDKSYLYYVLHTLFVGLTQAALLGFTYKYLWPHASWFDNYSIILFTCLVSIIGVQFLIEFMHLRTNARKILIVLRVFQVVYLLYLFTSLAGFYSITYNAILKTQSVSAVFILASAIYLYKKGFAEAKYYLIGWSSLMVGIIIYVAKDYGWLPYTNITEYALLYGSAAEVTLLSFALADKINIYKKEKEKSQEEALNALLENERIIREQNAMLENKVNERTHELRIVNNDLNKVLKDLKDAEGYLVENEKMAALGQLTAGIAHEINNPINFVSSNVAPLKRDVDMLLDMIGKMEEIGLSGASPAEKLQSIEEYKEEIDFDYLRIEIDHLLKGIHEGAFRTAEIVKGLRLFSRVDENDLKKADINEGIDSTLVLVNNLLTNKIALVKNYGIIPIIECYPGKLNQVFLNIISNAIHAIGTRHGENATGMLTITTTLDTDNILVKVKDNGTGMDDATRKKIFEPFFTTKEVGEGTGLGMSIAYNIIKKHQGQIIVNSSPGVGTEFTIEIPTFHQESAN